MPTVLLVRGWRFFFYANEGEEPPHIHVKRGDAQAKFWLRAETLAVERAYVRNLSRQEERQVQQIISLHFEDLLAAWQEFERRKS
jgi:hypothetical protein